MFLDKIFYNNTVQEWILSILSIIIIFIAMVILKKLLYRQINAIAQKTITEWDDLVAELIGRTKWLFLFVIAVYVGSLAISLPLRVVDLLRRLAIIAFLVQGAIWASYLLTFGLNRYKKQKIEKDAAAVTTFISLGFILRIILWSIIVLLALDNLGVNITALVAGLGVTGIAVALAVQNILGDLFASLSIVLDKPFVMGDFIIVDNFLGTIEHIGLKTTRIRSLSGEQLVFSNNDLLTSRIRNFKRMYERRVVFSIGVIYQTPSEKLKMIPEIIREIIEAQEPVRFDRAHFKEFSDYALTFEIVYWIQNPDYNLYMDIQQAINLDIYKRFEQQGIEFAYPTQLLYFHHATASPLPGQEEENGGDRPKETLP